MIKRNNFEIAIQFFKNSRLWVVGLFIAMATILVVLAHIELGQIEKYISDSVDKNAESLNSATADLDVFQIRKVLWIIYDGRTSYISYRSPFLSTNHFPTIELGILKLGPFQKMNTHSVVFSGLEVGTITYSVDYFELFSRVMRSNLILFLVLIGIFFIILFSSSFSIYLAIYKLERSINSIADIRAIEDIEVGVDSFQKSHGTWLFSFDSVGVKRLLDKIGGLLLREKKAIQSEAMASLAKQVSHDVRSPLSALNMVLGQLKEVPEHQRLIIRNSVNRINDIANTLLQKSKEVGQKSEHQAQEDVVKLNVELLPALIDTLISEKRIQFRDKIGIEIEADLQNSYGAFANINGTEMKRVLSNLINNAIEAFVNESGRVVVAIRNQGDSVVLTVKDNGRGIPKHIMARLGEMGVTHGKEGTQSGSGLGVYHAKKTIESFGGKFEISSIEGSGTTFTMTFPAATKPKWFVEKLVLNPNSPVISLDDDVSIHNIWRGRFQSVSLSEHKIEHLTFTSGDEFKVHVKALHDLEQPVYLVDYELLNQAQNGLQIIEEMNLGSKAILVTSRYEEPQIRSTCERLGVRLIPKGMAGFVPMEIARPKVKYHAILIDDDDLIHLTWNMAAKESNKNFLGFHSPDEFFAKISEFDTETPILIDSNLGQGIKGEVIAKKVHLSGFKKIYICTGYDSSEFEPQPWIIEILPKDPRFDF